MRVARPSSLSTTSNSPQPVHKAKTRDRGTVESVTDLAADASPVTDTAPPAPVLVVIDRARAGARGDGPGWHVEPTLLTDVEPGMTAFAEETFGPLATVTRARDDDHAVELANDTSYGLGAAVWGLPDRALAVGRRIRSGALFVNAVVASDPRLPFGGIGRSGYGRELSAEGIREFTNVRTVVVA